MDTFETIVFFATCFACMFIGILGGMKIQKRKDTIHQDCDIRKGD